MVVEQMNETPNLLIQLGEALGPLVSLVFLLLLSGGAVWVVMSVRFTRDDHRRFEADVATLRKESWKDSNQTRHDIENLRKESWKDSKETRDDMRAGRKESREDSRETKSLLQKSALPR